MKKHAIGFQIALFICIILGCKKEIAQAVTPAKTVIEVYNVAKASVYVSKDAYLNNGIPVVTAFALNGKVSIESTLLNNSNNWYIFAEDGCKNNFNNSENVVIKQNEVNKIYPLIGENGNISIQNTTNNSFKITVNNKNEFVLNANETKLLKHIVSGNINIKAVNQSTNVVLTGNAVLNCGATISFRI